MCIKEFSRNQTRFQNGNTFGQRTRFPPGRSGNPRGRPPGLRSCLRQLWPLRGSPGRLHAYLASPHRRRNETSAARRLLALHYLQNLEPIADAAAIRRYRRMFYAKQPEALIGILIQLDESPARREAARGRLADRIEYLLNDLPEENA